MTEDDVLREALAEHGRGQRRGVLLLVGVSGGFLAIMGATTLWEGRPGSREANDLALIAILVWVVVGGLISVLLHRVLVARQLRDLCQRHGLSRQQLFDTVLAAAGADADLSLLCFIDDAAADRWRLAQEESKRRRLVERLKDLAGTPVDARGELALRQVLAELLPSVCPRVVGLAELGPFSTPLRNTLGGALDWLIFLAILVVLLQRPEGSRSSRGLRLAIVAATDAEVIVVHLGWQAEELTWEGLVTYAWENARVRRAPFGDLSAECNANAGLLAVRGRLRATAVFQDAHKAVAIADAINSAKGSAS
ncbi:MAG: hypothetical protein FJX75_01870 [Armatimonadetes bacterium]|nr:hypothetical protein [Armatimonadota bacterium]